MICACTLTSSALTAIADDELRLHRQCARDADALALAAAELVRIRRACSGVSPTDFSNSATRSHSSDLFLLSLWMRSGSAMMLPTVMRGLSEP